MFTGRWSARSYEVLVHLQKKLRRNRQSGRSNSIPRPAESLIKQPLTVPTPSPHPHDHRHHPADDPPGPVNEGNDNRWTHGEWDDNCCLPVKNLRARLSIELFSDRDSRFSDFISNSFSCSTVVSVISRPLSLGLSGQPQDDQTSHAPGSIWKPIFRGSD